MIGRALSSALNSAWPMLAIFLVVLIGVRLSYLHINNERIVWHREIFGLLFVVYALLLFELLTSTELGGAGINLVPLKEILRYDIHSEGFLYSVIGNILIFVPFGYFVSHYVKAKNISHIFFITLATSLTVELVQLRIGRAFDIDDILLNVVGSIIGFLLYIALSAIKRHVPRFFRSDTFYNIISFLLLLLVIIFFVQTLGFGWLS